MSDQGSEDVSVLDGIRVVELGGGVAAGFCAHLLAGYGADVVQIGDPRLTPDEDRYLSRGKRRIDSGDEQAIRDLLAGADVVVDGRSRSAPLVGPSAEDI